MFMDNGKEKWLTLSEVIHQGNFKESETRRIVNRFGKYLGSRNFGDIIKYPPAVADAITSIANLYGKGWGTEAIMEILAQTDCQPQESIHEQLKLEMDNLLAQQDHALRLMQSTFELVDSLVSDIALLTGKLAAAEEARHNLREENRVLQNKLAQDKGPGK
ncbi:MAG: hypothetical protein A2Z73_05055 [Deltaproteobacteria bacterium RBG_13_60_28]|jgi:hypothetical protein|nr:MAG: hypothetical protein A2Z73_05055 [Deltaproteobacteria bacterium RBG_13_60_28]